MDPELLLPFGMGVLALIGVRRRRAGGANEATPGRRAEDAVGQLTQPVEQAIRATGRVATGAASGSVRLVAWAATSTLDAAARASGSFATALAADTFASTVRVASRVGGLVIDGAATVGQSVVAAPQALGSRATGESSTPVSPEV